GFRRGAVAPAAMLWRSATSRSLPKAAKIISRFHDCPPSKAQPRYRSRCIREMSPVIELVSFVSRGGPRRGFGGVPPAQASNGSYMLGGCVRPEMAQGAQPDESVCVSAFGARRRGANRRWRIERSLMTRLGHVWPLFAAMHGAIISS